MTEDRVAVLSASWAQAPGDELAVAVRSVAGALSRLAQVDVFVPGKAGRRWPDGAYEVTGMGTPRAGECWPRVEDTAPGRLEGRPGDPATFRAVFIDGGDEHALRVAGALLPGVPRVVVGSSAARVDAVGDVAARVVVDLPTSGRSGDPGGEGVPAPPATHRVGVYARVHPGARGRRHYGLRSTPPYLLVLGDRAGAPLAPRPSARVRWLLARFPRSHVVVVEGAVARVWRSRSCIAQFEVHTRMDLWLLMAHAWAVADLLPGDVFARESVEALRYGVPIVVPSGSSADGLVEAGGGLRFSDTNELLYCIESLRDPGRRAALASSGQEAADRWYGDPEAMVERVADVLGSLGTSHAPAENGER